MTHMSSLKTIVQLKLTNLKKKGTGLAEEEQGLTDPQEEKEGGERGRGGRGFTSGMQYAQQNTEVVPGSDGRTVARITCYRCQ